MRTVMHVQVKVPSIRSWGGSAVCTAVPAYSCWLFPLVFGSCLLTTDSFLIICKAEQSTGADPQGKGLGGKRRISTVDQTEQRRFSSLFPSPLKSWGTFPSQHSKISCWGCSRWRCHPRCRRHRYKFPVPSEADAEWWASLPGASGPAFCCLHRKMWHFFFGAWTEKADALISWLLGFIKCGLF